MEEIFLKAIATVGFPAVVCLYTLFSVNKNLTTLTDSINKLTGKISEFAQILETQKHEIADVRRELGKIQDELQEVRHKVGVMVDSGITRTKGVI